VFVDEIELLSNQSESVNVTVVAAQRLASLVRSCNCPSLKRLISS